MNIDEYRESKGTVGNYSIIEYRTDNLGYPEFDIEKVNTYKDGTAMLEIIKSLIDPEALNYIDNFKVKKIETIVLLSVNYTEAKGTKKNVLYRIYTRGFRETDNIANLINSYFPKSKNYLNFMI